MTNLLQLPQFFDLEIYTTGRLEKVRHLAGWAMQDKLFNVTILTTVKRSHCLLSKSLAPGVPAASDQRNCGEAYRH